MTKKTKTIKKDKIMVVFDDAERRAHLKSKFGSKKRRREEYLKKRAEREKEEKRAEREERRQDKAKDMQKFKQILEEQEEMIRGLVNNPEVWEKSTTEKSGNSKVKITTTFM